MALHATGKELRLQSEDESPGNHPGLRQVLECTSPQPPTTAIDFQSTRGSALSMALARRVDGVLVQGLEQVWMTLEFVPEGAGGIQRCCRSTFAQEKDCITGGFPVSIRPFSTGSLNPTQSYG